MKRLLPQYSLLSIVFLLGCLQSFMGGVPKEFQKNPILQHLKTHPSESALFVIKNDSIYIKKNTDGLLPLASISKIIVAIVFAQETAAGRLDPASPIPLASLERYNIDDDNYKEWVRIGKEEGWIRDENVPLRYVAQGAIRRSVSTNADFLMGLIGITKINDWIKNNNLTQHEPIFPFNASGILSHNEKNISKKLFSQQMAEISPAAYFSQTLAIQDKLSQDTFGHYKQSLPQKNANDKTYLKIWSDHFSKSTAREYARILSLLLDRSKYSEKMREELDFLFEEWAFRENPGLDEQLDHVGYKGGGTNFLLNTVLYTSDKQGNQAIVVLFLNDLRPKSYQMMSKAIGDFVFKLAMEDQFTEMVQSALDLPSSKGYNQTN